MLIAPKSGYISGCFDSFPHITSVLKEASLLLVKYWLDFSAHIRGPAWFSPALPRTPNQALLHPPTGLSILHKFELPQPSISSPVVCTISDNSLHISYTQAAPPTKTQSHMLQPSTMFLALFQCVCLHNTVKSIMHERCMVNVNGLQTFLERNYLSYQQGTGSSKAQKWRSGSPCLSLG